MTCDVGRVAVGNRTKTKHTERDFEEVPTQI